MPSVTGLLQAAATLTVLFSATTFANSLHRYLELFSHFRLQYLAASILLALAFVLLRNRRWALLMIALSALNAMPVAMWYLAETKQPETVAAQTKLLLINLYSGNSDFRAVTRLVEMERPDLIFMQELTNQWASDLDVLHARYPYRLEIPRNDNFGIAVFARRPFDDVEVLESPPYDFPSLVVRQLLDDKAVTFVTTHPMPPLGNLGFNGRNAQLAHVAETLRAIDGPRVLIGDLNTAMWGHHYTRLIDTAGLVNARYGFGVLPSWPTSLPLAMIPIDHCLVSGDFATLDIRTGPRIGSDHLPLIVTLALL